MALPEPRGCGVLEQSELFQGDGLLSFFDFGVLPFDSCPNYLRHALSLCFAHRLKLPVGFFINADAEHF